MSQVMQKLSQVKCLYTLGAKMAVRRTARRPTAPVNWKVRKSLTSVRSWRRSGQMRGVRVADSRPIAREGKGIGRGGLTTGLLGPESTVAVVFVTEAMDKRSSHGGES